MNCCNCICPRPRRCFTINTMPPTRVTTNIASFYNLNAGEISENEAIPLNDNVNLNPTNISHTTGSSQITLNTAGYYRISYNADITNTTALNASLAVTANGTNIPQSVTTATIGASDVANLSSEFVYNASAGDVLALVNNGSVDTTFSNVNVNVEYLGT